MTLRQVLLTGWKDAVQFEKKPTLYHKNGNGTVTAVLEDSGLYGVSAKVHLNKDTKTLLPHKALRGITMINASQGDSCIIHCMEFPWHRSGKPRTALAAVTKICSSTGPVQMLNVSGIT
ncbi:hypothetical protein J3458_019655 [Metarhizium acridum]|uniref:uncharacterized protein n=1 Tax=Metarhizium acridum TaxID=92637 RepID=UPI001C6C8C2C|nr:hypothetical protein J3458_019655 [Metarhizium acridum]